MLLYPGFWRVGFDESSIIVITPYHLHVKTPARENARSYIKRTGTVDTAQSDEAGVRRICWIFQSSTSAVGSNGVLYLFSLSVVVIDGNGL